MKQLIPVSVLVLAAACQGGGSSNDRMAAKVAEIERTIQSGSTTTIDRTTISYDGSHITKIAQFKNGAPAGTAAITYASNGIDKIEYTDKEGDRAIDQLTYADGRLTRGRYEVTGVFVDENAITYQPDKSADLVKEISFTHTPNGQMGKTQLVKYEYDAEGRTSKATRVDGTNTSSTEYRYDTEGRIDRVTSFSGNSVLETYTFSYTEKGDLDEVVDSKNNRYELTYDDSNRITEVRLITTGATTTTRYTYAKGNADGWSFAPDVPAANFFDLGGAPYSTLSMLHGTIEVESDIPKAGGGGGGGGVCTGFEPQDTCEICLAGSCCTQTKACLTGTPCYSYFECAQPCTTQACRDSCRSANPTGASAYDAFASCASSFCSTQCQ